MCIKSEARRPSPLGWGSRVAERPIVCRATPVVAAYSWPAWAKPAGRMQRGPEPGVCPHRSLEILFLPVEAGRRCGSWDASPSMRSSQSGPTTSRNEKTKTKAESGCIFFFKIKLQRCGEKRGMYWEPVVRKRRPASCSGCLSSMHG